MAERRCKHNAKRRESWFMTSNPICGLHPAPPLVIRGSVYS